jgi:hypothetical protein
MATTFTFLPVGVDEVATERSPWRIIFGEDQHNPCHTACANGESGFFIVNYPLFTK